MSVSNDELLHRVIGASADLLARTNAHSVVLKALVRRFAADTQLRHELANQYAATLSQLELMAASSRFDRDDLIPVFAAEYAAIVPSK